MDEGAETDAVAYIRIDVRGNVDAALARGLNERDSLRHEWPIVFAGGFEVVDVNGNVRFFADANGFLNGFEQLGAFVAHVREVNAVILRGDFGQLDNLFGFGVGARRINQGGGETDGAVLHRFSDDLFHLGQLFRRRRAILITNHDAAHLS